MRFLPQLLLCCPLLSVMSLAQTAKTGAYPFSTFESKGFDSINLGNLNTHFTIPIVSKPGRGLSFNYTLVYDGLIWSPFATPSSQSWKADSSWGFHGQLNGAGPIGYLTYNPNYNYCPGPHSTNYSVDGGSSNYVYHDPSGVDHRFNYSVYKPCPFDSNGVAYNPPPPAQVSGDGSTNDNSGLSLQGDVNGGGSVYSRDGSFVTPPQTPGGAGYQFDTNGNYISSSGSGVFTDTLGVTELTVSGGGTVSSPRTFSYPVTLQQNGGSTATVTVSYKTYTVQTNFSCPYIIDPGAKTVDLVDHITLPDSPSDVYTFTYETTPGISGAVTGRLASITLPSGGTISYAYTGGCNGSGINPDGTTSGLMRTTSDGSRSYTRATVSANATTTTLQDEAGNTSIYQFMLADSVAVPLETHRQVWQGNGGGSNLLDQSTCYNGNTGNCDGQAVSFPITSTSITTSYNNQSQLTVNNSYNAAGLLTSSSQLNGSTALSSVTNTYNSLSRTTSTLTADGSGNTVSYSTFGYDEAAETPTSGLPQHLAPAGAHGDLTSSHVLTSPGNTLTTQYAYDDAGQVQSQTALAGSSFTAATTYTYDSTDTVPTVTNLPTPASNVALSTSASFDTNSGALLSSTGLNPGQTTTVQQYDALLRPTLVALPISGATTTTTYTPTQVTTSSTIDASRSTNQVTVLDGYGRATRSAVWNGSAYYVTDSCYGPTGLLQSVGTAYVSSTPSGSQSCGSGDSYTYDALGRRLRASHADGSSTTWTYYSRAVKQVDSPGASKIMQYDLLGRLSSVCELSSNSSMPASGSPAACGTEIGGTGFLTNYAYDLANHKVTISQGAQTRVFQTDYVGRPTLVQEPERGSTIYSYAYNATGLVSTRTRPQTNQTNPSVTTQTVTQYDALGRVLNVSFSDGTPTRLFWYDLPGNSGSIPNAGSSKGRLIEMKNGVHGRSYGYDIMGRINETVECLPDWCGQYLHDVFRFYNYDYVGNLTSEQYAKVGNYPYTTVGNVSGPNYVTINYGVNQAGQLTSVTGGQNDVSGFPFVYNTTASTMSPYGPATATFGNGLVATAQYDAVGRLQSRWLCNGPGGPGCPNGGDYNTNYTVQVGSQVQSVLDDTVGRYTDFQYDDMGRLAGGTPHPGYAGLSMSATYDRYGNRWSETVTNTGSGVGPNTSFSFDPGRNQIVGMGYDAAGNLISDGVHSYQYDAENNLVGIDGGATATYAYNGFNQRQKATQNGVTDRYGLDLAGRRSTTWLDGTTNLKLAQYYGDRGPLAFWAATDGQIRFEHQDTLGTERVRTNAGGTELVTSSLPFGELVANTGTDLVPSHFALLDQDLAADSGLSHAMYREYSSTQGRWTSPDPYDGSYDSNDPQSLNRYSYVENNPLAYIDPDGTSVDPCAGYENCVAAYYVSVGTILNSFVPSAPSLVPVGSPGGGNFPGGPGYTGPGVKPPVNNPCAYQGSAMPPSAYAAKGTTAGTNLRMASVPTIGPALAALAIAQTYQFHEGGDLDSQPFSTGSDQQRAIYANYVFGIYFAGAGVSLSNTLNIASAYGYKQQIVNGAYQGRKLDSNHGGVPVENVQAITAGYNAQQQGTTCHH